MTQEYIKLKDLRSGYGRHKTDKVMEWDRVTLRESSHLGTFLYTSVIQGEDRDGFEAVMVRCLGRGLDDPFEETEVEVVFHAHALYDGVRHMYFNSSDPNKDCHGYLYYPDIPAMMKALQIVQEMQEKYCVFYPIF